MIKPSIEVERFTRLPATLDQFDRFGGHVPRLGDVNAPMVIIRDRRPHTESQHVAPVRQPIGHRPLDRHHLRWV